MSGADTISTRRYEVRSIMRTVEYVFSRRVSEHRSGT